MLYSCQNAESGRLAHHPLMPLQLLGVTLHYSAVAARMGSPVIGRHAYWIACSLHRAANTVKHEYGDCLAARFAGGNDYLYDTDGDGVATSVMERNHSHEAILAARVAQPSCSSSTPKYFELDTDEVDEYTAEYFGNTVGSDSTRAEQEEISVPMLIGSMVYCIGSVS